MALMKKLLHALWGVNDEPLEMKPPIECEACVKSRAEGKDACEEHHTHRARKHGATIEKTP